jgi:hypothetical protein
MVYLFLIIQMARASSVLDTALQTALFLPHCHRLARAEAC